LAVLGLADCGTRARRAISRRLNGSHPDYTASRVWAIRPGTLVNPLQLSGPCKERRDSLIVPVIIWGLLVVLALALMLMPVVGWLFAAGEWICLDRQPGWRPPENPEAYTDCSGHIDELRRKWGWAS
jgi:hypothetical protein